MKALIIGSTGFIGSRLKEYLLANGGEVWGTVRSREFQLPRQIYLDLSTLTDLNLRLIEEQNFTHMFDCSGVESLKFCDEHPDFSRKLIVDSSKFFAETSHRLGIKLVYISTSLVFDGTKKNMGTASIKRPIGNYAQFKSEAEEIVLSWGNKNSVIRFEKILHPSTPILISWKKSLELGETIFAFNNRSLSPISLEMACKCLNLIATKNLTGMLQLSASSEILYVDMAKKLCAKLKKPSNLIKKVSSTDFGVASRVHSCLDSDLVFDKDHTLARSAEDCVDEVLNQLIRI